MSLLKFLLRSDPAQDAFSRAIASYLGLVRATNRFVREPAAFDETALRDMPAIVAMWHGQHLMMHFARPPHSRITGLASRSRDGELNARVLQRLGVRAVRGSGARGRDQREKGGARAVRELLRALRDGETVVLTADVPKVSRQCGAGIVTLAELSGRPILPLAVVTSRGIDFRSWDRASLGLPFGRGAIVLGEPIHAPREADAATRDATRLAVQDGLDAVHARAYRLVGRPDPGLRLRPAAA